MSRFWGEPVHLCLSAEGCDIRAAGAVQRLPLADGVLAWPAGLAAHLPLRARVRAQVADRALRYLVLQWPAGVRGRKEREAWLAHQFKYHHGIDAGEWLFCRDTDPVGDPFIACAMPRVLLDALQAAVAARKGRVLGVTGRFVARFNALADRLSAPDGALATVDQGRMTLGVWRDGMWQALVSRAGNDGDAQLARRELTQLRITGEAPASGVLYPLGDRLDAPEGWTCVPLEAP